MVYVKYRYFSVSVTKKLGYQCIYSQDYKKYKKKNVEVIFNISPSYQQLELFILFNGK